MKKVDELLQDGLLEYGQLKTLRDAQRRNIGQEFNKLGFLFFNFVSINQRYDEFKVGSLSEVEQKVKVYYTEDIQKSHRVRIENIVYEILTMDPSYDRKYMFLFLQKVGTLDEIDHVKV
ncbi:phage head closure protein [Vaginisenegalia massiliensis]|uniref:phage head closure protein n=1 Tax=Vaginisenegalia massiliensis TaxID=2058294 RepID=UPI0013DE67E4|nr:phage head closure protein [Vaginisenegalia massiliensis]